MDISLSVESRNDTGKGAARKLRAAGRIPAVVYADGAPAVSVAVDPDRLQEIFRKTGNANTVLQLTVGDQTSSVMVKEAQRNPLTRELLHVDFYKVSLEKPVICEIPIKLVGKAAGVAVGGVMEQLRRSVKASCRYDVIPEAFEVDVTPLDLGQALRASQIPTGDGVKVVYNDDFNIAMCVGKKKG